jgi:glutathione S-transferase
MLTLYFAPGSSSMAVHIALHEIGVPFEGRPLSFKNDLRAPAFLTLNPEGKVPVVMIDGRPLTEVAAILFYLAKRFPEAELLPRDDIEAEAQALSWMSFLASTLHPARQRGLGYAKEVYGIADRRLGAGTLFDRRHSSVPAVLAACQFASPCAGNVPEPHRALSAYDGAPGCATNHRDRIRNRI